MLAYVFLVFAIAVRFLPHPWMFTPVAASLLFFGAHRSRGQMWTPVALLAVSDIILTKFVYLYPFTWDHYITWIWYAAVLALGTTLRARKPLPVIGAALVSSVSFFLISNFSVWAVWNDMYPRTLAGLTSCYIAGIPFFRHAVEGDLLFTGAMFATPALLHLLAGTAEAREHTAAI